MHAVERSPEPDFLAKLRAEYSQWDNLDSSERRRIREELQANFRQCCAYCENRCQEGAVGGEKRGTIDHFRPRSKFPDQWLDWLNLVYACQRCNDTKGNLWPEPADAANQRLSVIAGYVNVTAYVNPNEEPGRQPAEDFFEYYVENGQIVAANTLPESEWSMAIRTIGDLDLNSDYQTVGDRLPYLRRERLDFIISRLGDQVANVELTIAILREYARPDQPFSGFILAYAKERFPLLKELLE